MRTAKILLAIGVSLILISSVVFEIANSTLWLEYHLYRLAFPALLIGFIAFFITVAGLILYALKGEADTAIKVGVVVLAILPFWVSFLDFLNPNLFNILGGNIGGFFAPIGASTIGGGACLIIGLVRHSRRSSSDSESN